MEAEGEELYQKPQARAPLQSLVWRRELGLLDLCMCPSTRQSKATDNLESSGFPSEQQSQLTLIVDLMHPRII